MQQKINTFIFDCFGVICDPVLNHWYKENRLKQGLVDKNIQSVLNDFDLGKLSEDDILEYFLKYDGINSTKQKLRKEIDGLLKLDNKLADIILELKNREFKTVLLSNANASFFERKIYTEYPKFKSLFNEIIISSEVGVTKPDKEIYLHALQKIDSKPEESLFIDDSQTNVDGALRVGMQGFLYTDNNSFAEYIKGIGIDLAKK